MRIISGKHKGKKLKSFDGDKIRPTSDKAREALFSILYNKVIGADFLDLCCGTGAVGLEAISRGANLVTFVDSSTSSVKLCEQNLKSIKENAEIILKDANLFLKTTDNKFDIIFFDPPYVFDDILSLLKIIKDRKILKENAIFIYEHIKDKPSIKVDGYELINTKRYGLAVLDFYQQTE